MDPDKGVKSRLFQALIKNVRPNLNSRSNIQISNLLLSRYAFQKLNERVYTHDPTTSSIKQLIFSFSLSLLSFQTLMAACQVWFMVTLAGLRIFFTCHCYSKIPRFFNICQLAHYPALRHGLEQEIDLSTKKYLSGHWYCVS